MVPARASCAGAQFLPDNKKEEAQMKALAIGFGILLFVLVWAVIFVIGVGRRARGRPLKPE